MEQQQQVALNNQDGGTVSGAAPAFFVILKQQQGNSKTDQGILVANRDACALASSVSSSPVKTKVKTCLPADCTSGGITVTLDNNSMWNEFYHRSTEMILTKQGRRMFPYCRYWITGLNSNLKYILVMDISPVDNHRYKWNGRWWEPSGKAEPHVLGRVFIHPESPSTGHYWMHQPVSFYKLKLTNNTLDQEGHIILHSMHRYLPRLHLVPAEKATEIIQLNGPDVHTFTFPQTEFFAVTAYQNIQITQLKIDYNPFAKGFRDDGLNSKPQRDVRQKNSSDQEGSSVPSSPGYRGHLTESDGSEIQQSVPDTELGGHEPSEMDLEKASFNAERDFLGFLDSGLTPDGIPQLKQEASESPIASSFEDNSHVASPLDPNENFNVVIKEEPLDEYDYELGVCPEGVTVKQEDTDEETDVYSNSDEEPILEKQLRRQGEIDDPDVDHSAKRPLSSPSGVAKAKMLKLDSGKMPVVYLEPCAVTKSTVKISELPENLFSQSRKEKSPVLTELDYMPAYVENSRKSSFCLPKEIEKELRKQPPELRVPQKYSSLKDPDWKYPDLGDNSISKTLITNPKSLDGDFFSEKDDLGRKRTTVLKITGTPKASTATQNVTPSVPGKRGRPRKFKLSKAGRPPKSTGKSVTANKTTPMVPGNAFPDVKPDLEDVDGVLFVSFASKEALDIHTVDRAVEEPTSLQDSSTSDPGSRARICQLEQDLLEDLKSLRHKQVIHPGLQEVGLKLNSVDPTMSIDLKYLGVQLPLAPATSFPLWNLGGTNPGSPDAGFPFVSRTGKTNDFTKIKGWRGKFHSASSSKNEGGSSESSLKNRSAFCSDKLDEYLENEGKLMETSMGFSSNAPTSPVVYQLPTKSTSYVRTLDSVLKKQSTVTPSTSYSLKPHPVPSAPRKTKSLNKQAISSGRTKSSYKPILPSPVSPKQKSSQGDKVPKTSPNSRLESQGENFVVPTLDENVLPKQINLRQAHHQQHPATRPPGLSKSQVKLMDLEDCALWEGKPRTYITEERADVSLTTLLTAQASLKTKPIHKIIKKRAPPCNNDFCRLGCICASLALEKRQPAHCRRPDCMFGCTCLKRKVVLVKGRSKKKRFLRKAARRDAIFSGTLGDQKKEGGKELTREEDRLKEKKKRKKVEYTICDTEPEQPIRHYPLWVKVEGEVDPEPVYIPTPSVVEPVKSTVLPHPEILPTSSKNKLTNGVKPVRVYTPKPNPVIREEDKDPVYLYFESMMTCARVRVYERKLEEGEQPSPLRQQNSCQSSMKNYSAKEHDSEHQPMKQNTYETENGDKSGEKSWRSSCNEGESSSTSYMHQTSPGGPTKLIEIISDCNWEEDRNKILSILSQHINSNMPPQSLKVGSFIIELASQRKSRGEKNPPIYSSRVKISMPSCQDQDDTAENSDSETPDGSPSHRKVDDTTFEQTNALEALREKLHGGKALPFYAGLSPAGKLVAYKQKPSSRTSGLIEVNGKSYPQAKLLLGQMGALHPANRLAAYITGRLRPSVLDLSTLSTVISKVASNAKVAASRIPRTQVPSPSTSQSMSSSTTTSSTMTTLKAFVPAQRPIAVRPSPGGVFTQFVMSKVGALQQKIPGVSTPQPLTGPQKFSIRPSPVMVVTPVVSSKPSQVCNLVTEPVTTTTPQVSLESITTVTSPVTAVSSLGTKETTHSPSGTTSAGTVEITETSVSTPITPTLPSTTVNVTKATGIAAPITSIALPKSVASSPTITLPVASTASTSVVIVTTAASSSVVTTPTSSLGSVPIILSGINASPPASQRPENAPQIPVATSPVSPSPEKRAGPRLLLIPVQQGSPGLRPLQNMQLVQGQRMLLQPVRSPSGMNLFRHPNGQIVQLVPLQQVRGANTQPNLQPVMLRNPGSAVGIRLPAPSKPPETPPPNASPSTFSTMSPMIQAVGSSPPLNLITQASSVLSTVPSFVSQAGTLTLRISPPGASNFPSQTGSESKITYSSGGQPVGTASLIPLQSGSFALLQLPGQKPVPNSIIQHVASLQMKRESQNLDQKDETTSLKQDSHKKALHLEEGDVTEPENGLGLEAELPNRRTETPLTGTVKQDQSATASVVAQRDIQEHGGGASNKDTLLQEDIPADVISSDHSYISGSRANEGNKEINEEKENCNLSSLEEKVNEVSEDKHNPQEVNNKAVQTMNKVQLKTSSVQGETSQLRIVNEEQHGVKNPEEKLMNSELSANSKEDKSSRSKIVQEEVTAQTETKEKDCEISIEKKGTRESQESLLKENLAQKFDGISKEHEQAGDEHLTERMEANQENSVLGQKQSSSVLLEESEIAKNTRNLNVEIPNSTAFPLAPQIVERAPKGDKVVQGHLLLPGEQIQQHLKQRKKVGRTIIELPVSDVEEEEEEEEDEKTDDSADDMVDGISDYQSEEVEEVEKNNSMDYTEEEEQVDIETVEEFSEKMNIARLKASASHIRSPKQPCHTHVPSDEKASEKSRKDPPIPVKLKPEFWSEKLQKEAEAFAYYRRTHTANERRRRGEMRDLFEKLKITLGLLHSSKVSKSLILTRAFGEIQGLTDQADKLIGQKNLLTRKRNNLIRKVSSLSGKTEEVVLKKLEYIYAKQQALEAQKKKKKMDQDEPNVPPRVVKQQEGTSTSSVELGQVVMTSRRGKPLILARKRAPSTEKISPSHTVHNTASLVMTPQGQVLTLKGPLVSGSMVTVSPALLQSELKPQVTNSAVVQQESDDLFMMPRIVNVTSLATDGGLSLDVGTSKHSHEISHAKTSDQILKETIRNETPSLEDLTRISSGNNHGDGRILPGPTQDFVENKDVSFPQIVNVSSIRTPLETLSRKVSGGVVSGSQSRRKETESVGERLKLKEIPFRKLQVKDLKDSSIEIELRKVASAIEEATLDPNELLSSMEEEDDTDETLTSLLNEITFLNQQLNDDSSSMTEIPSSVGAEFPRLANAQRAVASKLASGSRATFQLGTLGSNLKELPEVQEASGSISPLLLHLEDDDLTEGERQPTETDVLKIVIDPEIKESFPSHRRASDTGKMTANLPTEPENLSSPPILHMKTGQESSSTDTLWRPMPKLAPLGLKLANPPSDIDGQSLKVMPCLAPIVAKGGSVGLKTIVTGHSDQEGQENKVMPTLAPVVAKLSNSGSSSSSSGK
ncbi:MAX gene-associated protein isoform X1 [Sarcophilus harrisii]|uniref:MAX gene-associated protein n=1 Tax=Sarcophilus harrisii TaxID=9305 RepID=A0A7N4P8V2_SARHA|nr:MAX gene-associated protein isoform X1 [Sarcophilus harrisii]XP_031807986.1 MAX gene-associated protein isoform X1 [Sarcophilus harrisii]XP_031807988.1 MAX gene-associated protein isoform X1 [Sarcophilus harrisii]XP_031807989.1 MAX gene-associated protein isoform X1 [Sarcophilus harrisii]XP_031807990.1 MAX gene-associated protein isoform X1 [Sarcophilus harrisii]XP_031807991.1 MAX gene-associated protein isoform X1 [Sarcophilus harrisii]XP_031807992.1 MAX gene-associated protein isoform X1